MSVLSETRTRADSISSRPIPRSEDSLVTRPFGQVGYRGRRIGLLILLTTFLLVGIAGRLLQVQIIERENFLGELYRHVDHASLEGQRGRILDRDGGFLVITDHLPSIGVNPQLVQRPMQVARLLSPILGKSVEDLYSRISNRQLQYVPLMRQVSPEVEQKVLSLDLAGLEIRSEEARVYPKGEDFARNLLGQVDVDEKPLNGLEAQFSEQLSGKAGLRTEYVSASGSIRLPGGGLSYEAPHPGSDIQITLHTGTQYRVEEILKKAVLGSGANWGAAIVLDVETAEVLALADVNRSQSDGQVRVSGASGSYLNAFEPGSVAKTLTIAAALDLNRISTDEIFAIPNRYQFADKTFDEPYVDFDRQLDVSEILAKSSNVGTIQISERLTHDELYEYFRGFGLGAYSSGLEATPAFPNESRGRLVPPRQWKGTDHAVISFGHSVSVTAIQLAGAYNVIANDGRFVPPTLARAAINSQGSVSPLSAAKSRQVLDATTATQMREMLERVVIDGTGKRAAVDGYRVAGKTGTAEKFSLEEGDYGERYTTVFAGFAPVDNPRVTVVVVLDEPTEHGASQTAAPVFSQITDSTLSTLGVAKGG